jgi:mRNA interferase MazF
MQPGEIYLAKFPFGDVPGMKLRPVLLLTGAVGPMPEVLVAYITSVVPADPLPSDILIDHTAPRFRNTHLRVDSAVRLHKLATLHCSGLARLLGRMEPPDFAAAGVKLRSLLNL